MISMSSRSTAFFPQQFTGTIASSISLAWSSDIAVALQKENFAYKKEQNCNHDKNLFVRHSKDSTKNETLVLTLYHRGFNKSQIPAVCHRL